MYKNDLKKRVIIAFGGNIGDVDATFQLARKQLRAGGFVEEKFSSTITTTPVGCIPGTPDFQNAALLGYWQGTAYELLNLCQGIEQNLGRPEKHSSAESRTIDLDLIIFGNEKHNSKELTIPHPRAKERSFVMDVIKELLPINELNSLL